MALELVENPDVIASIDAPHLLKVGFAAETDDLIANARAKIEKKGLAFIAANDVTQTDAGFQAETNRVVLLDASGEAERLTAAAQVRRGSQNPGAAEVESAVASSGGLSGRQDGRHHRRLLLGVSFCPIPATPCGYSF